MQRNGHEIRWFAPDDTRSEAHIDSVQQWDAAAPHKKPFEEITVGELCEGAQYPRATFYNYFDDKYDLLEYCWQTLAAQIGLSEYHHAPENEMLYLYFDRIYDFTRENRSTVSQILLHNPENGYMVSSFRSFLNGQMREIFQKCMDAAEKEIPKELLADHYSNTLFWCGSGRR